MKTFIRYNILENNKKYFTLLWYGLVLSFLFWRSLYLFFPGYLYQKHGMYMMALGLKEYSDAVPIYFSFFFKILINISGHYSSFMIFNEIILWLGLILIVTSFIKNHLIATLLILFVGLGPYYFPYIIYYYKDIPLGASMLLSFGLLLKARDSGKIVLLFFALYFLYFATSMRVNAFIAVFPVCIAAVHALKHRFHFLKRQTSIKGIALFILIFVSSLMTFKILTHNTKPTYQQQEPILFDLFGTSVQANQVLLPQRYVEKYEDPQHINMLMEEFTSTDIIPLMTSEDVYFYTVHTKEEYNELLKQWFSNLWHHPLSYLKHRWIYFMYYLYPEGDGVSMHGSYSADVDNLYASEKIGKVEHKILKWYFDTSFKTILKKPVLFFICYLFIIGWLHLRKWADDPLVIGYTLSGFFYLCANFFVGISYPFKYTWWSAICLSPVIIYVCSRTKFRIRKKDSRSQAT